MIRFFITYLILLFTLSIAYAEDIDDLEKQKNKTMQQIAYTNKILKNVRTDKKETISNLRVLNRQVILSKKLINNINDEIEQLNSDLAEKEFVIEMLEEDLQEIKKQYTDLIVYTYKANRNYEKLMFIFSSENFNQAYKRIKYLKILSKHRKNLSETIQQLTTVIDSQKEEIENEISKRELLIDEKQQQVSLLDNKKNKEKRVVNKLKNKEVKLLRDLRNKERIAKKLENEMEKLIAEQAKKTGTEVYKLTPEEKLISKNFGNNKGKLPWPTHRGIISSRYGRHRHPVLPGVYVENNGVDITTSRGEQVRSIFEGVVTKIIEIKGANYTIIIRHGNFLTVYQNVINVKVRVGDKVKTKENIGDVFYNNIEDAAVLHFEIWKEMEKQNPKYWLTGK